MLEGAPELVVQRRLGRDGWHLAAVPADALAPLFTGAMCAAGTLKAGAFGYPVLILKLGNFVLSGVWLALNHAAAQAHDYPLIRPKYEMLLILTPFVLAEAVLQVLHFAELCPGRTWTHRRRSTPARRSGSSSSSRPIAAPSSATPDWTAAASRRSSRLAAARTSRAAWVRVRTRTSLPQA